MEFIPCKANPNVWMQEQNEHYEYVGVYIDDLEVASEDPKSILDQLSNDHNFKLKGTGTISFYLGCGFSYDSDGVLCQTTRKFIEKIVDNYVREFGKKPRDYTSPLEKGDHPEIDTSEFLESEDIRRFQSLIGSAQWAIALGRFDIMPAVMTLSSFHAAP